MVNYWVVRADDDIRDSVEADGYIGIGFGGVQIGDITGLSFNDIRTRVANNNVGSSPNKIGAATGQLYSFLDKIQQHDWVLTPVPDRQILIGEVASNYTYYPAHDSKPHRRSVKWYKKVSRDAFTLPLRNSLGGLMTVFRVTSHAEEISQLVSDTPTSQSVATTPVTTEYPTNDAQTDIEYAEEIAAQARSRTQDLIIKQFDHHEFEWFIAALLKAMGFRIVREPQPGADGGVDIIAAPDVFGFEEPRIVVQVKHRKGAASGPEITQLRGSANSNSGKGLFVSTGGFTPEARRSAGADIALMDSEKVVDYFLEHYETMPSEYKAKVPLKHVYLPVPPDQVPG